MTSRMIGDFRVRCTVVQEEGNQYSVQICTRRVGGNAPEKCWTVPGQVSYQTARTPSERASRSLKESMEYVSMVNRNSHTRPHNGWWKASSAPRRWLDAMRSDKPAEGQTAAPAAKVPAEQA